MFEEVNLEELYDVNGGNVADKISGTIKIVVGTAAVVMEDLITKVGGGFAILDGICDWMEE